ncbi:MAG: short-chain dehydrogenase [Rhodospirillaceae bacterium]|nr:short-chain dehydrogenase [Rhodospirillaceae bacterium]HAD87943.1 short-chain dehydrogenase [Rhodospirillaceae bacterium]|tara:strand:- start:35 stop:760 length:726 start_codon:yes stop_codon:yes gene_type:complete
MNRNAVVTGASNGIGKAIASRLTEDGWRVINLDRAEPSGDDPFEWIETDLSEPDAIAAAFEEIRERELGPVTGLVNNAGVARAAILEESTVEDFDLTMAINMRAPMLCAQAVLDDMKAENFGRIVNIASRALLGKTHRTAYSGSKGGIASMGRVWALELAQYGVTVNNIGPGPIATELFKQANPPNMPRTQEIIGTIPVGRLGEPEDIAQAASFFMDEKSGFISGQTLFVCGGISLARGGS